MFSEALARAYKLDVQNVREYLFSVGIHVHLGVLSPRAPPYQKTGYATHLGTAIRVHVAVTGST